MKKIRISTTHKKILSDIYTPVGIYLRLRDRFRDTVLLESTDYHAAENSYSFICIHAIGGVEISDNRQMEFKLPAVRQKDTSLPMFRIVLEFHDHFDVETP
jgi:anthranilate synthase component 1